MKQVMCTFYIREDHQRLFKLLCLTSEHENMSRWLRDTVQKALTKAGYIDENGHPKVKM